jgi:hypothetical protein
MLPVSGSDRQTFALDRLYVSNRDDTAHTAHVHVTYDGDPIYWQAHALAARDASDPNRVLLEDPWPEDPGRYAVRVRVDDHETWATYTSVNSTECAGLDVQITDDGSVAAMSAADDTCDWG